MSQSPKPPSIFSILRPLSDIERLQHERQEDKPLDPHMALLKTWQSQRLARTYADLLASSRYRLACLFFLEDIYAPRDFSQRDHDVTEMYAFMQRFVPETLLRPLTKTIKLYDLTNHLDALLLDVLVHQVGITDQITEAQYAEAYRLCDNFTDRVRQIETIYQIGQQLDDIIRLPLTGTALRVAAVPSRRAGWTELVDFMERGFRAFSRMGGAKVFLDTIRKRERRILDQIYAHEPEPFKLERPA
jgi:hypothetical protein